MSHIHTTNTRNSTVNAAFCVRAVLPHDFEARWSDDRACQEVAAKDCDRAYMLVSKAFATRCGTGEIKLLDRGARVVYRPPYSRWARSVPST